jgi:hypothetical protein
MFSGLFSNDLYTVNFVASIGSTSVNSESLDLWDIDHGEQQRSQ